MAPLSSLLAVHTLMFISGSFVTLAAFNSSLPFDSVKSFAPVTQMTKRGLVLVVHPSVPVNSFKEYLAYAKASPAGVNFGTTGPGSSFHLAGALLSIETGTKAAFIHYKGSAPMVTDLLGAQVQVAFDNTVIPHIKSGKLRGLAVTGPARLSAVPDIPTAVEAGLAGYEAVGWMGLYAPKGTPLPLRTRLAADVAKAMASPDILARLEGLGFQGKTDTPPQFDAYLKAEKAKWAKVVKDAGVPQE